VVRVTAMTGLIRSRRNVLVCVNTFFKSLSVAKSNLENRRTARRAQRRLEDEILQMYATPTGRTELDAIMRRHPAEDVAPLDAILGMRAFR
jgi:hypothetical protein